MTAPDAAPGTARPLVLDFNFLYMKWTIQPGYSLTFEDLELVGAGFACVFDFNFLQTLTQLLPVILGSMSLPAPQAPIGPQLLLPAMQAFFNAVKDVQD